MKSLMVYLKDYKKETLLAPLFKMLEAFFELFVPIVMALIIDNGIGKEDKGYIVKMCMILIALAIIGLGAAVMAQFFAAKAAVGFSAGLRHALFHHIQKLSFTEMDTVGNSTLITRMTSDVNQVQAGVNLVLRLFLRSPFIVFGAMIMAFTIDFKSALIFTVTIPVLSVVVFGVMLISMPIYKKVQTGLDRVLGITRENLAGARVIRAFGREEDEIRNFEADNQILTGIQKFVGKISGLMNPVTYIIINVSIIALIWSGALRVDSGAISQGQVVALVNYMSQILVELIKLASLIITVTKALACAKRIESVFKMEPDIKDRPSFANKQKESVSAEIESIQAVHAEESVQSVHADEESAQSALVVQFQNVSLTYKNSGEESLSDISFRAERGETIGIIGGTGSGKTSLINLIPGFYEATKGQVLVKGRDVREYPLEELRSITGIVMQKAVLFKGSIRDNLLWGKKDATEDEMYEALEISQAKEFVDKKTKKLDSFVDQGGKNLSGGQIQRLTIARAVIKKPEILILDDSSSALDYATDSRLRTSIRNMKNNPTVFIVSQRTSSIRNADRIIVLDDGNVAGIGTHDELVENCSVYQEIYYSQTQKADTLRKEAN